MTSNWILAKIDNVKTALCHYEECGKKAKFKIEALDHLGRMEKTNVCGIHHNSFKKWANRMLAKFKIDVKFNSQNL